MGNVYVGTVSTKPAEPTPELNVLLSWADEFARMKVRANADNGPDANKARSFGAVGIGLLRVEHTVLTDELLLLNFRRMILTHDADLRRKAMNAMQPILRDHLAQVFEEMQGLPVTIRLLDPPLHEFLPQSQEDIAKFSIESGIGVGVIKDRLHALHEHNPMLGYRGVRLAIIQPEIVEMQARAIFEAAIKARYSQSKTLLEIMVPLVSFKSELDWATRIIDSTYSTMLLEGSPEVLYMTGSMIELPGACVNAAELATSARFFSFGTNDLTQTTLGISRDDGGRFLPTYLEHELMDEDPFVSINSCVAKLMDLACASAPDLKKGVCGEHGGDPVSAAVFEKLGLDYVSCSPYRVPAARLAVAQAAIAKRKKSAHSDA